MLLTANPVYSSIQVIQQKLETFTTAVKSNADQITINKNEIAAVKAIAVDARNRAIAAQGTATDARNRAINAQSRIWQYENCSGQSKLYKPGTGCIAPKPEPVVTKTCNYTAGPDFTCLVPA